MFVLQAGGACYSWRLPPPRWLGGCASVEARKEIVRCSGEELVRGIVLAPWGSQRATLVERVIELPHFWGRFLRYLTCGLGG